MLHACGLHKEDCDLINTDGATMNEFLLKAQPRMTLFTGSGELDRAMQTDTYTMLQASDCVCYLLSSLPCVPLLIIHCPFAIIVLLQAVWPRSWPRTCMAGSRSRTPGSTGKS